MNDRTGLNVLLVEDDDVAAEAVMRSFKQSGITHPVSWAVDGLDALAWLKGLAPDKQIPRPRLILLDLNMPRMNGFEFLEAIRSDPALRDEVVFVLTTSNNDEDRSRAYNENIAGYMVKSAVGPQFSRLLRLVESYDQAVHLP